MIGPNDRSAQTQRRRCSARALIFSLIACTALAHPDAWADRGKANRRPVSQQVREREAGLIPGSFIGPDLVTSSVYNANSYGSLVDESTDERISAFAFGATICNKGAAPAVWKALTNEHPVFGHNLYRLHDGRFEQVGMSWLFHAFFAVGGSQCGSCQHPGGITGEYLGVNCSDPESASIAGVQSGLSPRSEVNGFTGDFHYPFNRTHKANLIDRRLQVNASNLDPALGNNALYFVEAIIVSPDDAYWDNAGNNASYRQVLFVRPSASLCSNRDPENDFCAVLVSSTRAGLPAIRAWKEHDPEVVETEVKIPGEGTFHLSARATQLPGGYWRYEYALFNLNSHRSGAYFTVPVPFDADVRNVGFHAPFYHSGEPFSNEPWNVELWPGAITWATTPYAENPNANALRWGTLYNFRFETDQPPAESLVEQGLFRPGVPATVSAPTIAPAILLEHTGSE
jgi:hypothetical protein